MRFYYRLCMLVLLATAALYIITTIHMSQSSPSTGVGQYNEAELVALIATIYKTLIRLGHFEDTEVHFAPPEGFNIDVSQAGNFGAIDPRVLSLMKRLPRPPAYKAIGMAMQPVNYGRPNELALSRDIEKLEFSNSRHREGFARPTILLIADGQDDKHPQLVLDIADSTIREVGAELDDEDNRREVDPLGGPLSDHYLNWPKEDAKSYLERMIQKYQEADWVPDYVGGIMPTYDDQIPQGEEIKRALLEDYRWPGPEFRREDWIREAPGMITSAIGLED